MGSARNLVPISVGYHLENRLLVFLPLYEQIEQTRGDSMEYPPVAPEDGFNFCRTIHNETYDDIDPVNKSNCEGKYVLITGSARGIGQATAISFAMAGVEDILINNAGFLSPYVPLLETDEEKYWKTYEINIRGTYWVTKAILPLILATENGLKTIINLSSIAGHRMARGASSYAATKYAMMRFTEFLNVDYGCEGLLSYCLHPGAVMTELAKSTPVSVQKALTDSVNLPAHTIVFLSSQRRDWLAGRYISAVWDMPELLSREEEITKGDKLKMPMVV